MLSADVHVIDAYMRIGVCRSMFKEFTNNLKQLQLSQITYHVESYPICGTWRCDTLTDNGRYADAILH
jgi:hypothetical protein